MKNMSKISRPQINIQKIYEIFRSKQELLNEDCAEQLFWLLFLKVLDDVEKRLGKFSEGTSKNYDPILEARFQWSNWTQREWEKEDQIVDFINHELFPYLRGLVGSKEKEKIAEIFQNFSDNKLKSGFSILEAIEVIDHIKIVLQKDKDVLEQAYKEAIIANGDKEKNTSDTVGRFKPLIKMMEGVIGHIQKLIFFRYQEMFF